jgi:hypothetical protein
MSAQCGGIDGGSLGKPFRAEFHCHDVRTLTDGTQIKDEHSGVEARDSRGRTYVEQTFNQNSPVSVVVSDSTAGTTTAWFIAPKNETGSRQEPNQNVSFQKIAKVWHFPSAAAQPPISAAEMKQEVQNAMCPARQGDGLTCEDLGTRTFAGVVAYGMLQHQTVPTGQFGNDRPFVITYERWYSPEMRLLLAETTNDPRNGEHTMEVENIEWGEPPAGLFEIPAGYTVREQPGDQ